VRNAEISGVGLNDWRNGTEATKGSPRMNCECCGLERCASAIREAPSPGRRRFIRQTIAAVGAAPMIGGGWASPALSNATGALPSQRSWLIRDASIFTADSTDTYHLPGSMLILNGEIAYVGPTTGIPRITEGTAVIDGRGKTVLPGFINNHFHEAAGLRAGWDFPSVNDNSKKLSPSAGDGYKAALNFNNLFIHTHEATKTLFTPEEGVAFATWNFLGHLKGGTTTIGDLGSWNTTDALVESALSLGMRYSASQFMLDVVLDDKTGKVTIENDTDHLLSEMESTLSQYTRHPSGLLSARPTTLLPNACSDAMLKGLSDLAKRYDTPLGMHCCALRAERAMHIRFFGKSQIDRLDELGALNDRLSLTHCAFVTDAEHERMIRSGVTCDHAPGKYGFAGEPIISETKMLSKYYKRSGNLTISSDGTSIPYAQMIEGMRAAYLMHCETNADNTFIGPSDVLAMATRNPAKAMRMSGKIGSLEIGKQADIVIVRTDDFPYVGVKHKLLMFLAYGSHYAVDSVFVAGRRLIENGNATMMDENAARENYVAALKSYVKRTFNTELQI
jgi:5-methylthioadenosine/S-adenosylhomocysteine deaminase